MADRYERGIAIEPVVWFLVFEERTQHRWLEWVGRFKHVSAFGWVPDQRVWLLYDVGLGRTRVSVLPDCEAAQQDIHRLRENAVTLAITPRPVRRMWFRVGFWCVPAMAHLVGLPSCALRPDRFFRDCLRNGAEVVTYDGEGICT